MGAIGDRFKKRAWKQGSRAWRPSLTYLERAIAHCQVMSTIFYYNNVEIKLIQKRAGKTAEDTLCHINCTYVTICSINGGSDVFGTNVDKNYLRDKSSRKYVTSRKWTNVKISHLTYVLVCTGGV